MRRLFILLHKYTGLVLGVLLSITGISGSLIVFDRELDELLAPRTADFAPAVTLASLDLAISNARAAVNNGTEPTRIQLGRNSQAPHIVRFPAPPGEPGPIEVSVDPGTAGVTAVRIWGEYPVTWVYHLHYGYLSGARGEYVVGVMGLCLLFLAISGVVIWWPRGKQWLKAFTVNRRGGAFRLNYDLHKTTGIYLLPILVLLAFTGVEIVFPEPVEKLVGAFLPVTEYPDPVSTPPGTPISIDQAAAAAQAVFPAARLGRVYFPQTETAPYLISFIHPEETWTEYDATKVWVDQYREEVLAIWDSRGSPAGNRVLEWMFPLHNGDALGLFGRILVFVAGFLPALLFGTGCYMWWRKRRQASLFASGGSTPATQTP